MLQVLAQCKQNNIPAAVVLINGAPRLVNCSTRATQLQPSPRRLLLINLVLLGDLTSFVAVATDVVRL